MANVDNKYDKKLSLLYNKLMHVMKKILKLNLKYAKYTQTKHQERKRNVSGAF